MVYFYSAEVEQKSAFLALAVFHVYFLVRCGQRAHTERAEIADFFAAERDGVTTGVRGNFPGDRLSGDKARVRYCGYARDRFRVRVIEMVVTYENEIEKRKLVRHDGRRVKPRPFSVAGFYREVNGIREVRIDGDRYRAVGNDESRLPYVYYRKLSCTERSRFFFYVHFLPLSDAECCF